MKIVKVTIAGQTPLMMHNDRLANPLDDYARELKGYTSKRQKTDEDYEAMSRIEFLGGLYYNELFGVHIPARNLRKCIWEGSLIQKKGMAVKRGVFIVETALPLIYQGPKTPKELYTANGGAFAETRMDGTGSDSRVLRTREIFAPPWSLVATVRYDPGQINEESLRQAIEDAGQLCGLGDYRMNKSGGEFGRFEIGKWEA